MNLIKVYKQFPTQADCLKHLESVRWKGTPVCPYCGSTKTSLLERERRHHCNSCNTTFSVTVGTIFHKTKVELQKWFLAISLVLNAKKGISARQLARDLDVNKNTAWYMLMRIRKAMIEHGKLLEGIIEADETYIGGKNKNKHKDKRTQGGQGRNTKDKTPIVGVLERGGRIRAKTVRDVKGRTLKSFINSNVKLGSSVMTDEWHSYKGLNRKFFHKTVNYGEGRYVFNDVHTNTIENFWALLKRGIVGQYHHVTAEYLNCYINEFCFRHNNRESTKSFDLVVSEALNISQQYDKEKNTKGKA